MSKMTTNVMKYGGVAMGMGAAAMMAVGVKSLTSPKHKMKKVIKKSAKTAEGLINGISGMMK